MSAETETETDPHYELYLAEADLEAARSYVAELEVEAAAYPELPQLDDARARYRAARARVRAARLALEPVLTPWQPMRVDEYVDNDWPEPIPDLLERTDGGGVFYRGQVNWVYGPPGHGKTFLALAAAAQELRRGRSVLWIDAEVPSPREVANRLKRLVVNGERPTPEQIKEGLRFVPAYLEPMRDPDFLAQCVIRWDVELIVMDSAGLLLALWDFDQNSDKEVSRWANDFLQPMARTGAAVIVVDHEAKGTGGRSGAIGSQRKKAFAGGASVRVESPDGRRFSRGEPGEFTVVVDKDRQGHHTAGAPAAEVRVGPLGRDTSITVDRPGLANHERKMNRYLRLLAYVAENPGVGKNTVYDAVGGNRNEAQKELDFLLRTGAVENRGGSRRFELHLPEGCTPGDALERVTQYTSSPPMGDLAAEYGEDEDEG